MIIIIDFIEFINFEWIKEENLIDKLNEVPDYDKMIYEIYNEISYNEISNNEISYNEISDNEISHLDSNIIEKSYYVKDIELFNNNYS